MLSCAIKMLAARPSVVMNSEHLKEATTWDARECTTLPKKGYQEIGAVSLAAKIAQNDVQETHDDRK